MKLLTYAINKKELTGVLNREGTFVYPLSAAGAGRIRCVAARIAAARFLAAATLGLMDGRSAFRSTEPVPRPTDSLSNASWDKLFFAVGSGLAMGVTSRFCRMVSIFS